jgi:hypothetical protein
MHVSAEETEWSRRKVTTVRNLREPWGWTNGRGDETMVHLKKAGWMRGGILHDIVDKILST